MSVSITEKYAPWRVSRAALLRPPTATKSHGRVELEDWGVITTKLSSTTPTAATLSKTSGPTLHVKRGTFARNESPDVVITASNVEGEIVPLSRAPTVTCHVPAIVGAGPVEFEHPNHSPPAAASIKAIRAFRMANAPLRKRSGYAAAASAPSLAVTCRVTATSLASFSPMIRLHLLGALELAASDGRDLHPLVAQPKRLAVLAYLAARPAGEFVRRDTLLGVFWPELDQGAARRSLRQTLHVIRTHLGNDALNTRGDDDVA